MKGIDIKADKNRTLRYSINSMIEFEKNRGIPFTEALTSMESGIDLELFRYIFYMGLKWEDPSLTEEQCGDIMDIVIQEEGIEGLSEVLTKAIQLALGVKTLEDHKSKNQVGH